MKKIFSLSRSTSSSLKRQDLLDLIGPKSLEYQVNSFFLICSYLTVWVVVGGFGGVLVLLRGALQQEGHRFSSPGFSAPPVDVSASESVDDCCSLCGLPMNW